LRRAYLATFALVLLAFNAGAGELPNCTPHSAVGSWCEIKLNELRPSQPAVGYLQVEDEVARLADKSKQELQRWAEKKHIPVVQGPGGSFYLVDRHHLTTALMRLKLKKAPVQIEGRLTNPAAFWNEMQTRHWAWLKDESGVAVDPAKLPTRVDALPDSPYRSLAGYARDAGYYGKAGQAFFVEFAWAEYLRKALGNRPVTRAHLAEDLAAARAPACAAEASQLPGYPGKVCTLP
jgi:hypothetical protein